MKLSLAFFAAVVVVSASPVSMAADRVKTTQRTLSGRVIEMSALEVTIEKSSARTSVAVNEIVSITWDGEPAMVSTARAAMAAGRYEDALESIQKVKTDELKRLEVLQEVEFLKALASARLALAGNGNVTEAGSLMAGFAQKYTQNYHYLEACEYVGDLLVAKGLPDRAEGFYERLAKVPWPAYKMKAGVKIGKAQLAQGKAEDALRSFQSVLDDPTQGASADRRRLAATLGKARCLAEADKHDEAIAMIDGVIAQADPEQVELLAETYNSLGLAHRQAGRTKDAILAFLHVDLLYFGAPAEHITALKNLVQLWNEVQKPERADKAGEILKERYNNTAQ
jgi:tetratricopeptide (TPR) repeat protein